jgi:hypothetical protein
LRLAGGLLAVLIVLVVAFAMGSPASAAKPCWRVILDDWTDNSRIDKVYSIACYDAALANLPGDLEDYTDAADQIANARQAALRGDPDRRLQQSEGGAAAGGNDDPGGSDGGVVDDVLGAGSGDSGSIPLPLIILGVLAGLLMAAGAAGLLARKLQARRAGPPTTPQ